MMGGIRCASKFGVLATKQVIKDPAAPPAYYVYARDPGQALSIKSSPEAASGSDL